MKKVIFFIVLALSFSSFSRIVDGGATSGGGDFVGIDASKVVDKVFESIQIIGNELYENDVLDELKIVRGEIKIIMVDEKLPVEVEGQIQNGAAYSIRENHISTIYLNRTAWEKESSFLEHEVLIHHELMVLLGLERTGEYIYTKRFEEFRLNFWKLKEQKKIFCSINVYEKNEYYGNPVPGKLVGSGSSSMNWVGVRADMGILSELPNNEVLIWRGVIDSQGYFRMEIDKAQKYKIKRSMFSKNKDNKLPAEVTVDLGTVQVLETEKTYFNPYNIDNPIANPVVFGQKFAVVVNCNQF